MKNQKSTILAASFMFFGLLACNSENASEQTAVIENTAPAPVENNLDVPPLSSIPEISASQPTATIPPPSGLNPVGQFANSSAPLNTSLPLNTSANAVAATKSSVRLNPAHGQPGHDCAIAVGAPLKGSVASAPKPAPAPVQATAPNFSVASSPAAAPVQATAPNFGVNPNAKVNPAHGQPGHDCAVAVGAPLPVK